MSKPEIDYFGPVGGLLSGAFAAGCVACFIFCVAIGKWLWSIIGKAKDDEIASLRKQIADDRQTCAEMEARLIQRIQTLEGFIMSMAPGPLRQEIQKAVSEQSLETRHMVASVKGDCDNP